MARNITAKARWLAALVALSLGAAAATPDERAVAQAKELFRSGVALFEAGDVVRALDYFRRSRALFPSTQNGVNAAICLDRLGRFDEALELYEEVMTLHRGELSEQERAAIVPILTALRGKVGTIELSSNVAGTVFVDGRPRGQLPLGAPLRVTPGKRVLRVVKDAYATFEQTVTVAAEGVARVDAVLRPLDSIGQLRVETGDVEADVVLDGVVVGSSPWEGPAAPGPHVVSARRGARGAAPQSVTVLQGRGVTVALQMQELGGALELDVTPATAELTLQGVPLARGRWTGRLPLGRYVLAAAEPGYHQDARELVVTSDETHLQVTLRVDVAHPRWPKRERGVARVDLHAGLAAGSGFHGDSEGDCPAECVGSTAFRGVVAGVRASYRFPFHLGLELSAGYLHLGSSFDRRAHARFPTDAPAYDVTYSLTDDFRFRGPWLAAGTSYELGLGGRVSLVGRGTAGAVLATLEGPVRGTATTGAERVAVTVSGASTQRTVAPFVGPEVAVEVGTGPVGLSLGIGVLYFPAPGPRFDRGSVAVTAPDCVPATPGAVGCAPNSKALAGERAYGPFTAGYVSLGASRSF